MTRHHKKKKRTSRPRLSEHGRMAAMLLPPTPTGCPPYTRMYFETYRPQFFQACSNSRHRHCPRTSDVGDLHLYCSCPCHRTDLKRRIKRKLWLKLKTEQQKKERRVRVRSLTPRAAPVPRVKNKVFRYVKAPAGKIPDGIMYLVHTAIFTVRKGTVQEVAAEALKIGLANETSQDPSMQTNIMLHRMLKAGVVEVVV